MRIQIDHTLARWLHAQWSDGARQADVERTLMAQGFDAAQARALFEAAFNDPAGFRATIDHLEAQLVAQAPQSPPAAEAPAAVAPDDAQIEGWVRDFQPAAVLPPVNHVRHADGQAHVLVRLQRPHAVLFGDFLSDAECDALIARTRDKLRRADVIDSVNGGSYVDDRRTSELVTLERGESELVARIEARIAAATGIGVERGEALQVMRYGVGAEYQPHFDFFDPAKGGERAHLDNGGQRIATLIMYLADVEDGGETVFPDLGLAFVPRKGHALYFAYTDALSRCDPLSFHGGLPVGAGEKWIVTKWMRMRHHAA